MITNRLAPCIPAAPNSGHNFNQPVKFISQVMVSDNVMYAGQA